jgi:hypothetical protein
MTRKQAIKILSDHNAWRRGADKEMADPIALGMAIEYAINVLKSK